MFGFGNKDTGVKYGAIIDVGSGSVGVGIVSSDQSKKLPEILYSYREEMRVSENEDSLDDTFRKMREALFSACLRLGSDGVRALVAEHPGARIGRLLVTCSSPWAHTISRNIEYEHEKPFKITRSFIDELADNAEREAEVTLKESEIVTSLGLTIVERATINITANGYHVHDPFGSSVTKVALSHIIGLIPQSVIDSVEEVQQRILTHTKMSSHTYILVMYCVLRDIYPQQRSMCIIDVTGESTEIGIVEDGVLVRTTHVPIGSNTLVRELMRKTKRSKEDIISLLRACSENVVDTTKTQSEDGEEGTDIAKIDRLFAHYDEELGKAFENIFSSNRIPYTMITSAIPSLQEVFAKRLPLIAHSVTGETYRDMPLQPKILDEIAVNGERDVFITIAARFFHKLHGCGEIDVK